MELKKSPLFEALSSASNLVGALSWLGFGYSVIPIRPETKATATPWDPWLTGLTESRICNYWSQYPDHEVGFILGEFNIVFDADSPESLAALHAAEREHGVDPKLIIRTKRGEHHHFKLAPGTRARTVVFSTKEHPERLDIKTARSMVVLPPSKDKAILKLGGEHFGELSLAPQEFINALGAGVAEPAELDEGQAGLQPRTALPVLKAYLERLDPDMHRTPWFSVGAAVHHETDGSAQGYALYDAWSAGGKKYKGQADTKKVWSSIQPGHIKPATVGTLKYMLQQVGVNWYDIPVEPDDAPEAECL